MEFKSNQPVAVRICDVWMKATYKHKLTTDNKIHHMVDYHGHEKIFDDYDIKPYLECISTTFDSFCYENENIITMLEAAFKAFRLSEYSVTKKKQEYIINEFIYISPSIMQINSIIGIKEIPCWELSYSNDDAIVIGQYRTSQEVIKALLMFLFQTKINEFIDTQLS